MVIPPKYLIGHMFSEEIASVLSSETSKWGYIDHTGAFVIAPDFNFAMPFCAGLAHVETYRSIGLVPNIPCRRERYQGRKGFVDHAGKYIWRDPVERIWNGAVCN